MKILLINPPQSFFPHSDIVSGNLPLGLLYLGAVIEKAGYKVELLDAFMTNASFKKIDKDVTEVGMSNNQIKEEIIRRKPDVVGIANPFSTQIEHAKKIADITKDVDKNILTIVGGPHVTAMPFEFLKETKNVDIVVIGEGEFTLLEIIKAKQGYMVLEEVKGIAYRDSDDQIKKTCERPFIDDLDKLPFPAYHLVDMNNYLFHSKIEYRSFRTRSIAMITSRGCPFNCSFCSVHIHMGKKFRANSPDYIIRHLDYVMRKYNVKTVYFEDDNLTFDQKRWELVCDKIVEKKLKFAWETPNGIRADSLNTRLLNKMRKSGCRSIFFGVESGDQWVSDNIIHKNLDLKRVEAIASICQKINLKTAGFYIIGFPGEKRENMLQTVNFALKLKKQYDVGMFLLIATPSYGTKLYWECLKKGYIKDLTPRALAEVRQTHGQPLIETEDFSANDVKEIAAFAMKKYKKLSLLNAIKFPIKTLETIFQEPNIAVKFVKNSLSI